MNDKGMLAPYLASSLVNRFIPPNKIQFRLIKDITSTKLNEFLINTSVPVTLFSNMLTFRDTNKAFEIEGDLLKAMTNFEFNIDHSNPQDRKIIFEFGKEMKFDFKQKGRPSNRAKSVIKLLNSPAIMAPRISAVFLSSDLNAFCDKLKLLLQKN